MPTRDPRSRDYPEPPTQPGDGGREPTQSVDLDLGLDSGEPSPGPLALGTCDHQSTSIESPNARGKPLAPPAPLPPAPPAPLPGPRQEAPDPYLGAVLGSYRVLELLGKGGMGHVYRAEHVKLGREVALKLLRSDYASRRDAVARFFQEARTVNRIRHRNIVEVTDFVELGDGTTYIIMELLTGTSLGTWARGGVDLPRALSVMIQICDGLGAAHQLAIVHRDLKPDNVIVSPTPDGTDLVKLLDFGVAKLLDREDEDYELHTAAGSVIGTPSYMSPEQAGGMVVDARSDIYSLGAIMYELFCGQPVFRGRSFGDYVRRHLTEVPVPPRRTSGGAHIDPRLESVILRCLEKDPEHRFSSISELRNALITLHGTPHGGTVGGVPLALASSQVSHPHISSLRSAMPPFPTPPAVHPGQAPAPRTTPWWIWLGGAAAATAIGIAAAVWYSGDSATGGAAPATPAASYTPPAPRPSPPAPPPPPERVELRFDSQPSGGVFAAGEPTELCHTPCALQIDRSGAGAGDQRAFVVRRDGYRDGSVAVDLGAAQRDFHVELQPVPRAAVKPSADPRPDRKAGRRRDKPTAAPRTSGREPRERPVEPSAPPAPEPVPAQPSSPSESSGHPAIDPSDTLDPFRKK